jgi:hypothetical protein
MLAPILCFSTILFFGQRFLVFKKAVHSQGDREGSMESALRPDSFNSSSAASGSFSDELTNDIKATKEELQAVKKKIDVIEGGGDDLAKEHGYSTHNAALESLRAKEARLDDRLNTYEKQKLAALTQQQQQRGAGRSMLPVRQET